MALDVQSGSGIRPPVDELRLIRLSDVLRKTGMSRSWVYAQIAVGAFPAPVSVGPHAVAWQEARVNNWIASRIEASRKADAK